MVSALVGLISIIFVGFVGFVTFVVAMVAQLFYLGTQIAPYVAQVFNKLISFIG
jgi:hypothetical protein